MNIKKRLNLHRAVTILLILLSTSLIISACGNLKLPGSNPNLPCPIPKEWMENPPGETVELTLKNDACTAICAVDISPKACDDWGFDWLGYHNIYSGMESILEIVPGRYDIRVETCTQEAFIWEKIDLWDDYYGTMSDPELEDPSLCPVSLTVINNSSQPICHMWIAPPNSESFGLNWLGENQINSGDSFRFVIPNDIYDLKAEDCNFKILQVELDVEISTHQTWIVTPE
ncbi:MAG: hypothetical protein WBB69_12885 [Anaerolineales bacterium]